MPKYKPFNAKLSHGGGPVFEVRRSLNISQAKLAHLMGYKDYSTIARYERQQILFPTRAKRQRLVRVAQRYATPGASPYVQALAKGQKILEF